MTDPADELTTCPRNAGSEGTPPTTQTLPDACFPALRRWRARQAKPYVAETLGA
jgi:hypothetical protein